MNTEMKIYNEHINTFIRICSFMAEEAHAVMGGDGDKVYYYTGQVLFNGTNYIVRYYTGDCSTGNSLISFFLQGQECFRVVPILSHKLDEKPFGHECYVDKRMLKQIRETLQPLETK